MEQGYDYNVIDTPTTSASQQNYYWEINNTSTGHCSDYRDYYNISLEDAESYRYSNVQVHLLTVILPLILFFGVFGNVLFVYVAVRIPHMRTITNRYLVNLALADIVFLLSSVTTKIWKYAYSPIKDDDSPIGRFGCLWTYFLSDVAYFASLIFVTLVSADRFVAVCRPQDRHSFIKGKSMEIIGVCWLVAAILAAILTPGNAQIIVYCIGWPDVKIYESWPAILRFCSPLEGFTWITSLSNGLQTIPFFISLVLNAVLYVAIIRGLNDCINRMGKHGVKKSKDTGMRNQVAKMLVVNGVTFFGLLAPFEIVSCFGMIAMFLIEDNVPKYLITNENTRLYIVLVCQLLSYLNASVNPIIYTVMCRRYRRAFREAFIPTACVNRGFKKRSASESCRTGHSIMESERPIVRDTTL